MKVDTKFSIGDTTWLMWHKKAIEGRIEGVKVVAKEMTILEPNGSSKTIISLKTKYLIGKRWVEERDLARNEKELEIISLPL